MKQQRFCILGGSGFVGRHLVAALAARGAQVHVLTRRRERHRELLVLPTVKVIDADVHDDATLMRHFAGMDAVINLVGILNQRNRPGYRFADVFVELPRRVVNACRAAGVPRLLHMSALNADAERGTSAYLRNRGTGEDLVHAATDLQVTSFRPSVIFGYDDSFYNRFAKLLKFSPLLMPLACPQAKFAPVYVSDVVAAFNWALDHKASIGRRYDLCGPRTYTLLEIVRYTAELTGYRGHIMPLGDGLSKLQARLLQYAPGQPFTMDNYLSLQMDAVCESSLLEQFAIKPSTVETVVPRYLGKHSPHHLYARLRRGLPRD